ncbi:tripeptidyl peptidase A [Auriscalpium vulgare]|uniref:Tripeptidyl peptidase A n=1 Tax=Auriscalpium vulgare TaxID=40419 RepID=A0ACB8RXP6_9AGAM|nr:tripeptidyl peptidase A [Auriscalpium vulgare]
MLARVPYLLAVLGIAFAAPHSAPKIKERIHAPRDWINVGDAPSNHVVPLRIALPQSNFQELERHLYEISDPDNVRYGEHLSKEEVEELVAPHPDSVHAVNEWLAGHDISEGDCVRSPAKDWITVHVPVAKAEAMLDTKFHVWKHAKDEDSVVRTTSYSLPEHMHAHIELIQPTTLFSRLTGYRATSHFSGAQEHPAATSGTITVNGHEVDASCTTTITVSCLKQLYNAVDYVPAATQKNSIALTGYLDQFANFADLQQFYADQVPAAVNSTFNVTFINGGVNNQTLSAAGGEADLDVQFALGIAFPTPGTFYTTGGSPPFIPDTDEPFNDNEPYDAWLDYVLAQKTLPQTISTSYGENEQTVPESYAKRVCAGFAQLGARGVSLLVGSGDAGVGDGDPDPATQTCLTNDGRNATEFLPGFPASCPFVTAVGGTTNIPEVAVDFSGGGFSNYFARPSYQESAVTEFLTKQLPNGTYEGLYNPAGRAIPDVSAQADYFRIFLSGQVVSIGGTSAASPAFAGFVSLLNDARLSHGLPPLGFLNPLLYTRGLSGFHDITSGNAPGCGTPGFNATVGWDPVTGLGTPDFGKLKNIVL